MNKKVIISSANLRNGNGIASCIMSYYDGLLSHGYCVDFVLQSNVASQYMDYVKENGGNIFIYPQNTGKPNKENKKFIENVIQSGDYCIAHNNLTGLNGAVFLKTARKNGVKNIIHHSHNPRETSSFKAMIRSLLYDPVCARLSTKGLACSSVAGDDVFGKDRYVILPNAINPEFFAYDFEFRKSFRKQYGLTDRFVVGTVCRHAEQKNPFFIIDVFNQIFKKDDKSVLLWVGSGPLMEEVQGYVDSKGLHDFVIMLGTRQDVNKIYSAMDVFFLPSLFEGLGMVYIEAQASGLYCYASDVVPYDTSVTKNIEYISLNKNATYWGNEILKSKNQKRDRGDCSDLLRVHGFDLRYCSGYLAEIYDSLIK